VRIESDSASAFLIWPNANLAAQVRSGWSRAAARLEPQVQFGRRGLRTFGPRSVAGVG
jgi:hypothetical protein